MRNTPLCTRNGTASSAPRPGTRSPSRNIGAASSSNPRYAICRSQVRSLASWSRLSGTGSASSVVSPTILASTGATIVAGIANAGSAPSSLSEVLDTLHANVGAAGSLATGTLTGTQASCSSGSSREGPTSFLIAFSFTPSRCAIARLLSPWALSLSISRNRLPEIRRRPRRHPSGRPSPTIPPAA